MGDPIEQQTKEIVAEAVGIPFQNIGDSATLAGDLELDSLELINVAQELEENFGIELNDSDVRGSMTIGELVEAVRRIKGEK